MINVREYLRERQKEKAGGDEDLGKKIMAHRRHIRIRIATGLTVFLLILILIFIFWNNRSFESYIVDGMLGAEGNLNGEYFAFADGILVYSDDGISYIKNGETVWNQAFEMKEPLLDICGSTMAICGSNTSDIYIYNDEGQLGKIQSVYPVLDLEVSEQGVVAAITSDTETNCIEVLDKDGNAIATGKTYLSGDGCPVDITLSNDGTKLAASYVYLEGAKTKCKLVFYNYSEIGKNEVGRIVGGFNHYDESIVAKVEFADNDTVVAYASDYVTVYSMKQKPSIAWELQLKMEVKTVFYNENYIGMVVENDDVKQPNKIVIYDLEGNEKLSLNTDFLYTGLEFGEEYLVLHGDEEMILLTVSGRERFRGIIEEGIKKIVITNKIDSYYIINENNEIMNVTLE